MVALKGIVVLYLCAALALTVLPESSARLEFDARKWHIHIINGFTGGRQLVVHCWSTEDDLGSHTLNPGMETNWTFRINFSRTTKLTCEWRSDKQHVTCPMFWKESQHQWLRDRCDWKNCFWIAKDGGIYLRNIPAGANELIRPWE